MEEKDEVHIYKKALANTYYGFLERDCAEREIIHTDSGKKTASTIENIPGRVTYVFHIERCKTCGRYHGCSKHAGDIALKWYEGELRVAEADRVSERMEKAREYIEFLKEGRGEYRY